MRVDVLHNAHPDAPSRGFTSTDPLIHVQQFDVEESHDHEALTHVLWLTSVAHREDATSGRPDEQALRYHAAGHRPLRVGDVVVIGTRVWAHAQIGWTLLTRDAPTPPPAAAPTTTPTPAATAARVAAAPAATPGQAPARTAPTRTAPTRTAPTRTAPTRTTRTTAA